MSAVPVPPERHEVKIDLQGLIRLLAKNLYAEADVFVREMVQNAHDSIRRRAEIEGDGAPPGVIRIRTDDAARTITITDNGSGLTEPEIHDYLSTIGRSGTGEFRQELMRKGRHAADVTLIGQFGIGLLSAFVVAHRVEVETRSVQPGSPAWRWVSEGQSDYELGPGAREDVGTTVTLHVSDGYRDMLDPEALRKAIKKYADFISYPIHLNDAGDPANAVNAPWHHSFLSEAQRLQEYWRFVNERFPDFALEVIPVHLETPCRVEGVLYISDQHIPDLNTAGMVDVYQARMFITAGSRDLLPEWAKFVRGVIDSPDLTPTAARDAIQLDTVARQVREALGGVVIQHLQGLAERDPIRFERILAWHSYHVKGMAVVHDDFFDAIADLAPFETNRGPMNLRRYREHSPRDIFFFSERGAATQFYLLCNARGLLVISAGYLFEEDFLRKYAKRRPDVRLHPISVAGSEFLFEPIQPEERPLFQRLESDFQRSLPDPRSQARVVRFQPAALPAVTVLTADAKLRAELEQARRSLVLPDSVRDLADLLLEDRKTTPVLLHLNADNPTIQQMAQMARSPIGDDGAYAAAILAIYNNALLLAQHEITPESAQAIFASFNNVIKRMIDKSERLARMQARLSQDRQSAALPFPPESGHIVCLAALPSPDRGTFPYDAVLLPALRRALEQGPFYWQVVLADEKRFKDQAPGAHACIADISDGSAGVMMALGYLFWAEPARPRIVLERAGAPGHLAEIAGLIRVGYPDATGENAVEVIARALSDALGKQPDIQALNRQRKAHYLSPLVLSRQFGMERANAELLAGAYATMESLVAADVEDILGKVPSLRRGMAAGLQADIRDFLRAQP